MPACRWVVIAEQCYDELVGRQRPAQPVLELPPQEPLEEHKPVDNGNQPATEPAQAAAVRGASPAPVAPVTAAHTEAPAEAPAPLPEPDDAPASPPAAPPHREPALQCQSVDPVRLKSLPPSFRADACKFADSLAAKGGFKVDNAGRLILDGKRINFLVEDLLRITNVPFNRDELPIQVESWLRAKNVTKFRNPSLVIRPAWTPVYSLRKSTMARRAER